MKIVAAVLVIVVAILAFAWISGSDEPAPAGQIDRRPEPSPFSTAPGAGPSPGSQALPDGPGAQPRPVSPGTSLVAPEASAPGPGAPGSGPRPDLPTPGSPGSPEPALGVTSTGQVLTSPEDSGGAAVRTRPDPEGADSLLAEPEPGSLIGDPDDPGLPPEFDAVDLDYGAPEDGVPQIEGPPPEASDPGVTGTAPEDSEPPDDG